MTDFAAIDFETANEQPSSICSVGVVIVRGGEVADTFYSLIHPEPEYYQWFCQRVHGLSSYDTDSAPVFPLDSLRPFGISRKGGVGRIAQEGDLEDRQ